MTYAVDYTPAARRMLRKLPATAQATIHLAVEGLAGEPRPSGSRKLTGSDFWRLRLGDYRVVYAIEDDRLVVLVVKVAHRREVYR